MATLSSLRDNFLQEYLTGRAYKRLTTGLSASDADTLAVTSNLPDSDLDPDYYLGWTIFRASLNVGDANRERIITSTSSTDSTLSLNFTGPDWTNTNLSGEVVYLIKLPDGWSVEGDLHPIINTALRSCLYEDELALGNLVTDGDMRSATASDWTGSFANLSKVTTRSLIYHNTQALFPDLTEGGGYAESAEFDVEPNRSYVVTIIAKVESGTAQVVLRNATAGSTMSTHTWSTANFSMFSRTFTTASAQRAMRVRVSGADSVDDVYYSHVIVHDPHQTYADLPTYINSNEQIRGFYALVPSQVASGANDVWLVKSASRVPVDGYTDYQASFATDAVAHFPHGLGRWPVFADIVRPGLILGTDTALTAETATTPVTLEYALPTIAAEFWSRFTLLGTGSDLYDERLLANFERAEIQAMRKRLEHKPRTARRKRPNWASQRGFGY